MLSLKKIKKVSDTYNYNFKIYNFDSKTPIIYNNGTEKDTYYTFFETEPKLYKPIQFRPPNLFFTDSIGLNDHVKKLTGYSMCNMECGIRNRPNASILKSVDDTYYYSDDLNDPNVIEYSLFGPNGDQSEQNKYNSKLLVAKNIYVFRLKKEKNKRLYTWYGKYKITGKFSKQHVGEDHTMRTIIVLILHKI